MFIQNDGMSQIENDAAKQIYSAFVESPMRDKDTWFDGFVQNYSYSFLNGAPFVGNRGDVIVTLNGFQDVMIGNIYK